MADEWHIQSLFHFTVNATDFERSLEFYTTIGFKVLRDNTDVEWPQSMATSFGLKRAKGKGALLGIGDGPDHTRLDLLQWFEPEYDPPSPKPVDERVPRLIALRTHNVAAAYRDLSAKGIQFISEVVSYEQIGILGVVLCRDPDGLLVEFIEYAPGVLGSLVGSYAKEPITGPVEGKAASS
jgi:catechol 2,3-dioxygenase-like lactoylglutathione lyase family enzyme